jgi:ferredoxin
MKRKIIEIDEKKCDGCGQCIDTCHEGALALVEGKARLVSDTFCDGLGACLGECPRGALAIVEREAADLDLKAIEAARVQAKAHAEREPGRAHGGCPGSALRTLAPPSTGAAKAVDQPPASSLGHWPIQLMLVPAQATFLVEADLVVCADCVPFAVPDFHARYLAGRAVVVGCPKLDDLPLYFAKLTAIVRQARPRRLTVVRMEVPCCRGIAQAAVEAAEGSDLAFPVEEHIVKINGGIERRTVRAGPGQGSE